VEVISNEFEKISKNIENHIYNYNYNEDVIFWKTHFNLHLKTISKNSENHPDKYMFFSH
jgi:hypothetical protein